MASLQVLQKYAPSSVVKAGSTDRVIKTFTCALDDGMRSFDSKVGYNFGTLYDKKFGVELDTLCLSRPLLLPSQYGQPKCLVGTDNPIGATSDTSSLSRNFVACISTNTRCRNPILAIAPTEEVRFYASLSNTSFQTLSHNTCSA